MLEDELHRLYILITMDEELQSLRFENEILREIMLRNSIPLPAGVPLLGASWAEVTFTNHGGDDQQLQVKLPDYSSLSAPQESHSSGHDTHTSTDTSSPSIQSTLPSGEFSEIRYDQIPPLRFTRSICLTYRSSDPKCYHGGMNLAQMGVDFVLS